MFKHVAFVCIAAIFTMIVTGCQDPRPMESWKLEDVDLKSVKGLEDCQFYRLQTHTNSHTLKVIRCPNSSTSTNYTQQSGKTSYGAATAVIDNSNVDAAIKQRDAKIKELTAIINEQTDFIAKQKVKTEQILKSTKQGESK